MEHVSSYLDLPVSQMQMKMVGHVQNNLGSQYFSVPNEQMGMVEPLSSNSESETSMVPSNLSGNNESSSGDMVLNPNLRSNQLGGQGANVMSIVTTPLPVKRKVEVGPFLHSSLSQPSRFPTKRPAHSGPYGNSFGFLQQSAAESKTMPVRSELVSPGKQAQSMLNKKIVRNDSMSGKSAMQQGQNAKKQTARIVSASKTRSESSEAVRSKMRESLVAALELAFQNQGSDINAEKDKADTSVSHGMHVDSQASNSNLTVGSHGPGFKVFASKESATVGNTNDSQLLSADILSKESSVNGGKFFEEFQFGSFLPDEDVSFNDTFFAKDDLLQGNGLSWAFEFDAQMREAKQVQDAENLQPMEQDDNVHVDRSEEAKLTPNDVAFEIEDELFKLFGGVNKKYREKGRSLLFNLKDHSNPELRGRVMSGEISPEKLCSMSAEELASKELSQWRMAKAEEFAQMVVLPDTEVDVRRLVKKTHKGEYQVEVERDDGIVSEVSSGTSMLTQAPSRKMEMEGYSPSKEGMRDKNIVAVQENGAGNQDVSGSLIIPTDGTDFMQGIIVDEIKDPALLPPVVSLDEFMESLNAEPPFGNMSPDAEARNPLSHKESPKSLNNSQASDRSLDSPKDTSSKKVNNKNEVGMVLKSFGGSAKQEVISSTSLKVEYIWQGKLLLNIGSSVTVGGLFQSGEKTSTKEWSTSLEIKGKVKLDAFEKFLQDLPMSRTRAVMVLLFVLKDKTSEEEERSNLSEAVNSYMEEQRLGYAEPAAGVELYLCPPTPRMKEMLNKHMPKHTLTNNPNENELTGVVVWRRAHISNEISPNSSSSHHKHSLKRQPLAAPQKRAQDSPNVNAHRTPPPPLGPNNAPRAMPEPEDDEDIPPGFGPVAVARVAKDDDDLPEFNFSGHLNRHVSPQSASHGLETSQRPVDQVRELIKRYGQSDTAPTRNPVLNIEPWDDDDDDIPEWQPEAPHIVHNIALHGHRLPAHLLPSDRIVTQPQHSGGRWVRPPGPLHGSRWRPY